MRFVLPLLAAFIPVVIAPGILFYFDVTPKLVILLIGVAAALILWSGELPPGSRLNRFFFALLGLQLVSLALSTAFSVAWALSLNGGNWRRFGLVPQAVILLFAALVASDCAVDRKRVTTYLKGILAGGILVALYAILQYFGWDPLLPKQSYHVGDVNLTIVRPPSTMGHASYLATYLLFVVFAAFGLIRARVWRIAAVAALVLACTAILMSGTRAALLGLIAGGIVVLWSSRSRKLAAGIAAAAVLAGLVFYLSPAGKGLRSRVAWVAAEPAGGARPLLWRDSLRMSAHHLGLGYGPETFIREFPQHESLELAREFPDFLHESPHNIFLDALIAQGIPGLSLLLAFCVHGLYAARHTPWAAAALAACMVAQLFTSFILPLSVFFFLILALLIEPGPTRKMPMLRIAGWCCALVLAGYAVRISVADRALAASNAAIDANNIAAALLDYEKAQRWALPGSSADLYYSRRIADLAGKTADLRFKAQAIHAAMRAALDATRTSEEPANAWYNFAAFASMSNAPAQVEHGLNESIEAAPNWYKPHWVLAQLYVAEHRLADAQREAELAVKCNDKAPEVLRTLENIRAAQRH